MRLRCDERELILLRGAEQLRGMSLAHTPRTDQLRSALSLAKAQKAQSAARKAPERRPLTSFSSKSAGQRGFGQAIRVLVTAPW